MSETDSMSHPDALAALRNPYVRKFAIGRMASSMGAQIITVAIGWELWKRTGDPWALGLVGLFEILPVLFLMIPAGNIADRFIRRNVAMGAYATLAISALGLTWISYTQAPVELVYGLLVIIGAARCIASPSVESILPQIIERRVFGNAQAWLVSSGQISSIGGPALGGILIGLLGAATWTYLIAAVMELIFVSLLATFPPVRAERTGQRQTLSDIFAGFAFIRRHPVFLAAITLDLFGVMLGGAVALLPIYAEDILQIGPEGLGMLRAAPALGALAAALMVTRLPPFRRPGVVLLWMVVGFGASAALFGVSTNVVLSLVCLFLTGAFDSVSMVIRGTLQQMITPDHLRGRVLAVEYTFIGFSNEFGTFRAGAMASFFGPVLAVLGGGIGTIVVVAVVAVVWPSLAKIGPLHTLRPLESERTPTEAATA
ncbi:MAG: MFS transporter [Chloroflexi bacterium]|nr:MFS transporter [Chloroflexota bacterium]